MGLRYLALTMEYVVTIAGPKNASSPAFAGTQTNNSLSTSVTKSNNGPSSSSDTNSDPKKPPKASGGLSAGAAAGIVLAIMFVLLSCMTLHRRLRKRKQDSMTKSNTEAVKHWRKPELDGKSAIVVELMAERDPTELPAKAMTVVEMPTEMPLGR